MLSLLLFCRTGSFNGIIGMLSVEARQRAYLNRFCRSTCFKLSRKSLGIGKCAEPSFQMPLMRNTPCLLCGWFNRQRSADLMIPKRGRDRLEPAARPAVKVTDDLNVETAGRTSIIVINCLLTPSLRNAP